MKAKIRRGSLEHPVLVTGELLLKDTMPGFYWAEVEGRLIRIHELQICETEPTKRPQVPSLREVVVEKIVSDFQ